MPTIDRWRAWGSSFHPFSSFLPLSLQGCPNSFLLSFVKTVFLDRISLILEQGLKKRIRKDKEKRKKERGKPREFVGEEFNKKNQIK